MPGSVFGIPSRPTSGQGVIWQETLGGRMDTGALGQVASGLSGLTLNRVPFGNSLGGLQDSGNLTFDGTTLALAGAQTISTTLGVTGLATHTAGTKFGSGSGTLNYYETGNWTPVLTASGTAGTHTYSEQIGRYIRIGNLVFATCNLSVSSKDGAISGNVRIGGLPFTVNGSIDQAACVSNVNGITFGDGLVARAIGTITSVGLSKITSGGSNADVTEADLGATPRVYMTTMYTV